MTQIKFGTLRHFSNSGLERLVGSMGVDHLIVGSADLEKAPSAEKLTFYRHHHDSKNRFLFFLRLCSCSEIHITAVTFFHTPVLEFALRFDLFPFSPHNP
jgi:hypothetical protein